MNRALAARVVELGLAQREVLEQRLAARTVPAPPLVRGSSVGGESPASASQRSQWFVHQLDPHDTAFNKTDAVRITGPLDTGALERAVSALVARHEVLRTVYRTVDGEPVQVVGPVPASVLRLVEWEGVRGGRLPAEVRRAIIAEANRPFDLSCDLLYRVVLHRLGENDHVLTRTSHHIAFDKWSSAVANRELGELYAAMRDGRGSALSPLPLQYSDYAAWQRDLLTPQARAAHVDFFTAHLAGAPVVIDLPTSRTRPARPSHRGATVATELPPAVVEQVRTVARAHGATAFMVLLAAYGVLVGGYVREEQLLVGVPVAGRNRQELEGLIGVFINTVVVRIDTRHGPTFAEMIRRVRRSALGVIAHQDLPFSELVKEMAPDRPGNRTPLFQVMFDYINTPDAALTLDGVDLEPIRLADEGAVYDLTLYVHDRGPSMRMVWEYPSDLFDRPEVAALAEAFTALVTAAVGAPHTPAADLPVLGEAALERTRRAGSGPIRPHDGSVIDAVLRSAAVRPGAPAVRCGDDTLTYGELAGLTCRLAAHLHAIGVGVGDRVGVLVAESSSLPVVLLAIMASGATAVLLDPGQPRPRLEAMIAKAGVEVAVVAGDGVGAAAELGVQAVEVDTDDARPDGGPPLIPVPAEAAYVVFTSGSTGSPKGVVVGHHALANFVSDAVGRYGLEPSDRVLQFAAPGFDTVLEEILPTLVAGGTVVMRTADQFPTFEAFVAFVHRERVTVLDLPTAWWHAWVDEMEHHGGEVPASVRLVIVGGEAASTRRWTVWRRVAGEGIRWVNTYGPSETTVVVAAFEPPPGWSGSGSPVVPIGYPITNTRFSAVDGSGRSLPPYLVGELEVGGTPVALGYLGGGDSGFVEDPVRPPTPSFRTGDLVRMLPDGMFEFVGRVDGQVKIRGTRVEPGEVEAVLRLHPRVRDAAVVAVESRGELVLAAHLVSGGDVDVADLRRHVAARLPIVMMPVEWHGWPALPLTPSGKIDRLRLTEAMAPERTIGTEPGTAAATPTEQRLGAIWASVLGRSGVGRNDDFFDLGGHSLLGVRLISRIADSFGVELPLRTIFDAPTLSAMATVLDRTRPVGAT